MYKLYNWDQTVFVLRPSALYFVCIKTWQSVTVSWFYMWRSNKLFVYVVCCPSLNSYVVCASLILFEGYMLQDIKCQNISILQSINILEDSQTYYIWEWYLAIVHFWNQKNNNNWNLTLLSFNWNFNIFEFRLKFNIFEFQLKCSIFEFQLKFSIFEFQLKFNILEFRNMVNNMENSSLIFFFKSTQLRVPYISWIRRTKSVIWNNWISKYLNSNFGKSLERLLDISLNARTGKFVPHLFTGWFSYYWFGCLSKMKGRCMI